MRWKFEEEEEAEETLKKAVDFIAEALDSSRFEWQK